MSGAQRLVVGLDAAGEALDAATMGIELARRFGAAVELVHAVEPHGLRPSPTEEGLAAARRALRARLEGSLPGALLPCVAEDHHLIVEAGHPAPLLLRRAALPGTGLLLLGGHRRLRPRGTAPVVMARADCPVWRHAGEVRVPRRILVPVDLSKESLAALDRACEWAGVLGARVTALHCFLPPELVYGHGHAAPAVLDGLREDARVEFEAALSRQDWRGVEHDRRFEEAFPATRILELQDEADLIMMGTHGRTGLTALVLGSVAGTVLREAHIPVVTLRVADRPWLV